MLCKIIFCGAILSTSILRRQNVKSLVFLIYIFTPPIICSFLISLLASGTRVHTRLFAIVQVTDKNTLVQSSSFHLFPVNLFGMVIRTYCLRHEKYALKNVAYLLFENTNQCNCINFSPQLTDPRTTSKRSSQLHPHQNGQTDQWRKRTEP